MVRAGNRESGIGKRETGNGKRESRASGAASRESQDKAPFACEGGSGGWSRGRKRRMKTENHARATAREAGNRESGIGNGRVSGSVWFGQLGQFVAPALTLVHALDMQIDRFVEHQSIGRAFLDHL